MQILGGVRQTLSAQVKLAGLRLPAPLSLATSSEDPGVRNWEV